MLLGEIMACQLTRCGGTVGILGSFYPGLTGTDMDTVLRRELCIQSSNCYGVINGVHDYTIAIDLILHNKEIMHSLITHEIPFEYILDAFELACDKKQHSLKVQLYF